MTPLPPPATGNNRLSQVFNQLRQCVQERTFLDTEGLSLNRTSMGVRLNVLAGTRRTSITESAEQAKERDPYLIWCYNIHVEMPGFVVTYDPEIEKVDYTAWSPFPFTLADYVKMPLTPTMLGGVWAIEARLKSAQTATYSPALKITGISKSAFSPSSGQAGHWRILGNRLFCKGVWPGTNAHPPGPYSLSIPSNCRFQIEAVAANCSTSFDWYVSGRLT